MDANAVSDAITLSELDNVQGRSSCANCQERSYLRILVGELLYKNQILRFELSQSQALARQLRLVADEVQAQRGSTAELQGVLNVPIALLKSELESGNPVASSKATTNSVSSSTSIR